MRAIAGAAVLMAAAVVGCGTVAATHHKRVGDGDHDPVVPIIAPAHCLHLRPAPGQRAVSLSLANDHETICLRRGTGVFVFLHSPVLQHEWSPIMSSSTALSRRPSGVMALARGVTGAYYVATGLGRATLTSSDVRCLGGPHPELQPRRTRCPLPLKYSVTVYVQA